MLRKGDYVVMHSNLQARINSGVIWACECDEFLDNSGNPAIRLKDYNDVFYTAFLQKVDVHELANMYALHPEHVKSLVERMDGLAIKGNVVYAPKQSFLLPLLGGAGLFAVIVILPMLAN